jgi:hypothetical protein
MKQGALVFARLVAVIAHVLLGITIFFSGLEVHPIFWLPGLLAWMLGIVLIARWWSSHPGRVVAIPLVLAAVYYAVALEIGDRTGLNGA